MAQRWSEIGTGVFVRRHESLDLNIGAVLCEGGVALIDTRATPNQARDLQDSLRAITRLPVRWVINTHHHWDHTFGNQVFTEAAIWGHERCASALRSIGEEMKDRVKRLAPGQGAEFDQVVITPPTFTMVETATVTFGDRPLELRYLGRGHTDNDIVVVLPDVEVVFAGDLVEDGAPPSFGDSFPMDWPATLSRLGDLAGGAVVPGHGAVVDSTFVAAQRDELEIIARLARERHTSGMTPSQAAELSGPYTQEALEEAFGRAWQQLDNS